jgi:hypothetical protein
VDTDILEDDYEGSMFLQNSGTHLQVHVMSQPRRPPWTSSLLSPPQISYTKLELMKTIKYTFSSVIFFSIFYLL